MTREEMLIDIAMEECAEIIQRLSKAQRFGMNEVQINLATNPEGQNNYQRLKGEITDLVATLEMINPDLVILSTDSVRERKARVEKYLGISAACGRLT
jgi:hypothetical protein